MAVETERYGFMNQYPADVMRAGRRPLLQYPAEALQATMANPRSCGVALRDRVSQKLVAYALGSPLENHDEQGVRDDPHHGSGDVFYLQAVAISPRVQNQTEMQGRLFEALRAQVRAAGFGHLSSLIEETVLFTGPDWVRGAAVLHTVENYLGSGIRFVYLQAPVGVS